MIVRQFGLCVVNGDFSEAEQIIAQAPNAADRALQQSQAGQVQATLSSAEAAAAGSEPGAAAAPPEKVVDEDGFELVTRGKGQGRQAAVHAQAQRKVGK